MKIFSFLIVLILNVVILNASKDTTYKNSQVLIKSDTLFYHWEVKHYIELVDTSLPANKPLYNGNIFFSGNTLWGWNLISKDNLETWQTIKPLGNLKIMIKDFCLLPNNRIIATVDTVIDGKMKCGIIYEFDYNNNMWIGNRLDIFKDKVITNIDFKDNLNGVLAVSDSVTIRHLYRTENGGKDWYKLDNISNLLEKELFAIINVEYFKESDILMCVVYNINTKLHYFVFSKDFGNSWSELRLEPKKNNGKGDYYTVCGFYSRNDSLWFASAAGTGHGDGECTEFIYFSPDLGKTWIAQYLAISDHSFDYFTSVEFFDNSLIGLACEGSGSPRVLITFDGGDHWTWIRDTVTLFAQRGTQPLISEEFNKSKLIKANNEMIFFGLYNRIFKFKHHNLPTSVDDKSKENLLIHYNSKAEAIELNSDSNFPIELITLYDLNGRVLFSSNNIPKNQFYITKEKLQNTKVVFAVIQANNQMFIKQIMCE